MKKIGIVGGGQLGRMLAFEAKKMGMYVAIVDPTPQSPAGQVSDFQILGDYKDTSATKKLAKISDVVTIDAEFVNDEILQKLEDQGKSIHPSSQTIKIIKDKFSQKKFLKTCKIPTAEFIEIENEKDILKAGEKFGYPFLLKARTDAYDGKGNFVVSSKNKIQKGQEVLLGRPLYAEKYVPFIKELSVVVARSTKGELKNFPVVETIHKNNICDIVIVPAQISAKAKRNAEKLALQVMKKMKGAGVFAIEMFLKKDGAVLVNEIAPRVHNSGHFSIEACFTSQFEQHIRAITGLPLGDTSLKVKYAVMKNILGTKNGQIDDSGLKKALKFPGVSVHLYGKKENRIGRKMGHITAVGNSLTVCLRNVNKARKELKI